MSGTRLSIIVPVLNEAPAIQAALAALSPYRGRGMEVIVVDGGSRDGTPALAHPLADRSAPAPRGRAAQMNAGAAVAQGKFCYSCTRTRACPTTQMLSYVMPWRAAAVSGDVSMCDLTAEACCL